MEQDLSNNKIKLCIVGTGEWGQKISHIASMFNRYKIIGIVNSSTPDLEKQDILNAADMVYLAIPKDAQVDYINFCIENDKFLICEAPFLSSSEERKQIFEKLKTFKPRSFFINSAYFLDTDFARIIGSIMTDKANFISVHCSGPKYQDDAEKAKKFYSNQAIFLLLQLAHSRQVNKCDQFIINDENSGFFLARDLKFEFKWSYSDEPKNTIRYGKDDNFSEKVLIYDEYDQVFPILKYISDQYYGNYLPIMQNRTSEEISDIYHQVNMQSYLISSTSEYFSDIFSLASGKQAINDPTKLFFNGGL